MMFNDASGCRTEYCVAVSHMTRHSADGGALKTTLGGAYRRQRCKQRSESKIGELMHFRSLAVTTVT